jgi:hypothetical protein
VCGRSFGKQSGTCLDLCFRGDVGMARDVGAMSRALSSLLVPCWEDFELLKPNLGSKVFTCFTRLLEIEGVYTFV